MPNYVENTSQQPVHSTLVAVPFDADCPAALTVRRIRVLAPAVNFDTIYICPRYVAYFQQRIHRHISQSQYYLGMFLLTLHMIFITADTNLLLHKLPQI